MPPKIQPKDVFLPAELDIFRSTDSIFDLWGDGLDSLRQLIELQSTATASTAQTASSSNLSNASGAAAASGLYSTYLDLSGAELTPWNAGFRLPSTASREHTSFVHDGDQTPPSAFEQSAGNYGPGWSVSALAASSGETSSPLTALMGALAGPIPSTTAKAGETSGISILAPFTDNWTFFAAEREAPANRHDAVAVAPHHDVAAHTDTVGAPALDTAPSVSKISAESPTPATQSQTSLLHQAWSNGDTIDTTGKVGATPQQLRQAMDQTAASGDGKGIKIGLLSDSFDFLKGADADKASGALPSSVEILKEGTSGIDEGRAMLQIVHTIAPGASLAFYSSPGSEQDFADGIRKLADAGCKVICDDIFYYHEPMFQNGPIAKAIQEVVAKGVTYVTLAGNNDGAGYQGAWKGVSGAYGGMTFKNAMSFNGSIVQNITVDPKPGSETPLLLWWDEAYGQAKANLQIHVFQDGKWQGTTNHIRFGVPNDPWTEYFFDKPGTYQVVIDNASDVDPGIIREVAAHNGRHYATLQYSNIGTVYGHSMVPGAISVGAVNSANTPPFGSELVNERFSSSGQGTQLLFDDHGNRLPFPIQLHPVTVSGVDNIATTVTGPLSDFYGTSAATPTVAALAALMLAANSQLTPFAVSDVMQQTALEMKDTDTAGAGLVRVDPAVAAAKAYADVLVEFSGNTSLSQHGINYFITQIGGWGSIELKANGKPVIAGLQNGWVPIGAEATANGYQVAWKLQGSELYSVWTVDPLGNLVSKPFEKVAGTSAELETAELAFHQDLNHDGIIGVPLNLNAAVVWSTGWRDNAPASYDGHSLTLSASASYDGLHTLDRFHFAGDGKGGATISVAGAGTASAIASVGDPLVRFDAGHDAFVFASHFGDIRITDFDPARNTIAFSPGLFASQQALLAAIHDDGHGNAVIADAAHDTLTLDHVSVAALLAHQSQLHIV